MGFSRILLYNMIYALAARDGREAVLFGSNNQYAQEAFANTPTGDDFPELWFEIPLLGDPWFDLHVLTARTSLHVEGASDAIANAKDSALFKWFAGEQGARQLAYSWDTGSGQSDEPAIQLLVNTEDPKVTCEFLDMIGRPDASAPYRAFRDRLPDGWFACYTGIFPSRPDVGVRVECIPSSDLQQMYAQDPTLIEQHFRQVGLDNISETIVPRCHLLSQQPFQIEFQFNVRSDGSTDATFSASSRFACPPGTDEWAPYETEGVAGDLMRQVEQWGLADDRWKLLEETAFATRIARKGDHVTAFNYPAFLKLRWRNGEPLDAKAYLIAGAD